MAKNRTKRGRREETVVGGGAECSTRSNRVVGILNRTRQALRELVIGCGLEVFQEFLEEDREALCGPRYERDEKRGAYRYGHDTGQLVLGGRKVTLPKPRVRSIEGREVPLPMWEHMRLEDPLQRRVAEQIVLGVSSRKYAKSLEPLPDGIESEGVSRSSVSRHFVARTQKELEKFFARSLKEVDLPIIMVDGINIDDHVLVVALGIDRSGKKQVLGLAEGSTENEEVCANLFRSLIERGLVVGRARLFVIDGGKGIRRAIRRTFGAWALVQRCRVHKIRNVLGCLPEERHASVRTAIHDAWSEPTQEKARAKLKALAARLKAEHPGASSSLLEGLDETLTILSLHLPEALERILSSTNAIENLLGTLRHISRNVKRWRGGEMAVRWAATAFMAAEKRFRRIRGHREIPALISALDRHAATIAVDIKAKVA